MRDRPLKLSRRRVVITVLVIALVGFSWWIRDASQMPGSRTEVDSRMDQDILAYEHWNDQHVIVFVLENPRRIYIDTIHRDWMNMGVPWFPRLQWSGNWAYVDASSNSAGVGYGWGDWGTAFFGQVNDPAIVSIRCQMETYLLENPVASPGYALKLLPGEDPPVTCDFLDASGSLVWTAPVVKSVV